MYISRDRFMDRYITISIFSPILEFNVYLDLDVMIDV